MRAKKYTVFACFCKCSGKVAHQALGAKPMRQRPLDFPSLRRLGIGCGTFGKNYSRLSEPRATATVLRHDVDGAWLKCEAMMKRYGQFYAKHKTGTTEHTLLGRCFMPLKMLFILEHKSLLLPALNGLRTPS